MTDTFYAISLKDVVIFNNNKVLTGTCRAEKNSYCIFSHVVQIRMPLKEGGFLTSVKCFFLSSPFLFLLPAYVSLRRDKMQNCCLSLGMSNIALV